MTTKSFPFIVLLGFVFLLGGGLSIAATYEYHCSACQGVWYKSCGGYAKCPNTACGNNKAGIGSSGKKTKD